MGKSEEEPAGCLAVILKLFGVHLASSKTDTSFPYGLRDDFLSAAELSFMKVLQQIVSDKAVVLAKVNLADLFFVKRPHENIAYKNKIDRKHVDYLLCDPTTLRPRCGIELDDSSHARKDRQARDAFVDQLFKTAGLPLLRVPAKRGYELSEIHAQVETYLMRDEEVIPEGVIAQSNTTPSCPKCGGLMVERHAKKGEYAGRTFWGCSNYPKCRQIIKN